jgi:hypothetical protein
MDILLLDLVQTVFQDSSTNVVHQSIHEVNVVYRNECSAQ